MTTTKISRQRLKQIIKEEITAVTLQEAVDHKSISTVIGVASKLLSAIEAFKEKAPASATNAVTHTWVS